MFRSGNYWYKAMQDSFYGHMKDHLMKRIKDAKKYQQIKDAVDDYYNNECYVWDLAYLSPNEYYKFTLTGKYPFDIPNPPKPPVIEKQSEELGKKKDSDAEKSVDDKSS